MVNHVRQFFSIRVVFSRTLYLWSEVAFLTQVARCPLTQPTSKDTHCIDKRVGNLPASFRSLVLFLGSIAVRSLALVSVDKRYRNFLEFREKLIFRKHSTVMIRSIWILLGITENSIQMVSARAFMCLLLSMVGNYGPISKSKSKFQTLSKMLTKTQQQLREPAEF